MDPKLAFWTGTTVFFTATLICAGMGWRAILRGEIESHRRYMNASIGMILFFVGAYVVKVFTLGKEDIWSWTAGARAILWTHESIILIMLITGAAARWMARRLPEDQDPTLRRRHRLSGRGALVAGVLALLTALFVLANMFRVAA